MSMKPEFQNRDFKKNPLTRQDTQIPSGALIEEEAPFRAQQSHNDGKRLDTAKILAKYAQTGVITHTRDHSARYLDATHLTDFREIMSSKAKADEVWLQLPDDLRTKKFHNDPKEFVEFCLNTENLEELRTLGLAQAAKAPPAPVEVIVTNPAPTEPPQA